MNRLKNVFFPDFLLKELNKYKCRDTTYVKNKYTNWHLKKVNIWNKNFNLIYK